MTNLVERLRASAEQVEGYLEDGYGTMVAYTEEGELWASRMREAAAALEAAREESNRWRDRYRAAIDQARGKGVES